MAHEISNSNGINEAFYAFKPAWHGLGTILDHAPDSAAAIIAAHLDWEVNLEQLKTVNGGKIARDHFATVRQDTGDILGVVSDRYQIVQNRDAFDFLDGLLEDGIIRYESAGALRGGRVVWLLARMPSIDVIAEGDETMRYILFSTSHDGSAAIHAIPTSVRVVCANTLRIATAGNIGIRHTGDVSGKLEFARQYLSQFDSQFTSFRDNARLLATRKLIGNQARDYINALFPEVKEDGRAKTIRENKVSKIRANYRNSRQNIPSIKGSWWSLFNSVTELIDHDSTFKGKGRERSENKMLSVIDGNGAEFKSKAFKLALEMAS